MYLLLPRQELTEVPPNKPADGGDPNRPVPGAGNGGGGGMSPVGVAMLVIFLLLIISGVLYVAYVVLRARRLGLPTPHWKTYIPFMNSSSSRSRPSTGPLGWIKSKLPSSGGGGGNFMGGGSTGYTGAAERNRRTHAQFGQLRQDDDEAWDARGYRGTYDPEDENELQNRGRGMPPATGSGPNGAYGDGGLNIRVNGDGERGRSRSREPPFPKIAQAPQKFPGVDPGPRPISTDSFTGVSVKGGRASLDGERRSVFREAM